MDEVRQARGEREAGRGRRGGVPDRHEAARDRREAVRRRRLLVAVLFSLVAIISFTGGAAVVLANRGSQPAAERAADRAARPHAVLSSAVTVTVQCASRSLDGHLPTLVSLPVGYRNTQAHYPVIYFLHGLPAGPTTYRSFPFVASQLAASGRHAIVVQPQGARSAGSDREYLDWDAKEDWPQAIASDLVRCVDSRFRTVRTRFGRALMGLSAGGYGAMNIGLRNLSTFAAVESWSGYFVATNPAGTQVLNLGSAKANRNAAVPSGSGLRRAISNWPTLIAFYVGANDGLFLAMNRAYNAELNKSGVPHFFRVYAGGHTVALWSSKAQQWLGLALDAMASEARQKRPAGSAALIR